MSYPARNNNTTETLTTNNTALPEKPSGPRDYLERFIKWGGLGIIVFLTVFAIVMLYYLRLPPVYEAKATIMTVGQDSKVFSPMNFFWPQQTKVANYVELLRSQRLADLVAEKLPDSLIQYIKTLSRRDSVNQILRSLISARGIKETDMIQVSATVPNKQVACAVVNTYVASFIDYDQELNRSDVSVVRKYVEAQFAEVKTRLDSLEKELEQFKSANQVVDIGEETKSLITRQSEIAAAYEKTVTEVTALQTRLDYIRNLLQEEGKGLADRLENISSPLVANLKATLNQLEVQKTNLLIQGFAENSNEVHNLDRQIDSIRNRLRLESQVLITQQGFTDPLGRLNQLFESALNLETEITTSRARQEALKKALKDYEKVLAKIPASERALAKITRDVETARRVYSYLSERYEEARIQEIGRIPSVRIVDLAQNATKVRPNIRTSLLLALFFAVICSLGSVWLADWLDTSVHTPEELERLGFTVLASIPDLKKLGKKGKRRTVAIFSNLFSIPRKHRYQSRPSRHRKNYEEIVSHLLTHSDSESSGAEAFRILRTNLSFSALDRPFQTIAVTSPLPGEGKSTVAINLAAVLAQAGARVLLIDADIRYPLIHTIFQKSRKPGFTDLVLSNKNTDGFVFGTRIDRLLCLPSGTTPPNPADLFISPLTNSFIERIKKEYNYILFDTAPTLIAADTPILSSLVDLTIMVITADKTPFEALKNAYSLIQNAGGRVAGVIVNRVNPSRGTGGYHYYYYYKYRYYQRAGETAPLSQTRVESTIAHQPDSEPKV